MEIKLEMQKEESNITKKPYTDIMLIIHITIGANIVITWPRLEEESLNANIPTIYCLLNTPNKKTKKQETRYGFNSVAGFFMSDVFQYFAVKVYWA